MVGTTNFKKKIARLFVGNNKFSKNKGIIWLEQQTLKKNYRIIWLEQQTLKKLRDYLGWNNKLSQCGEAETFVKAESEQN